MKDILNFFEQERVHCLAVLKNPKPVCFVTRNCSQIQVQIRIQTQNKFVRHTCLSIYITFHFTIQSMIGRSSPKVILV